ncbi:NAD(P)/FAD-dependent oxidoreductase [Tropicimonas sp. IMCC34043]|uniref:flavin-dependent monooxygenase QhpG n=1 Tax=Tropicimonas sp. IMCC34043 TaxID=2248760 RepID=UPI000E2735BF|nr:hypothetical protein [Tropicimonas sp. IMCC34043]
MAQSAKSSTEVLVLGAGPAASLAAIRLARAGAHVHLIGRPDPRPRIEGASPRVVALLRHEGLDTEAFGPPLRRRADWAGLPAAPNTEHPVDRQVLDRDLLELARASGVRVTPAEIASVRGPVASTSAGEIRARHIVEARGRRAPSTERAQRGPATIAIAGWVAGAGDRQAPGTALVATPLGWQWRVETGTGRRWVQICLDASAAKYGAAAAWAVFHAQPGVTPQAFPAGARARACELRLTAPRLDPARLRVGDAAVAIDPLSGHGLFWALSSALMAPPLLAAIDAGREDLARRFHADRVTETFWRQARISRDFHALAAAVHGTAFWRVRATWPDALPAHAERTAPESARKVILRDGVLTEAEVLLTPQEPAGAAFVRGLPLAPVLDRFGTGPLPEAADFAAALPQFSPAEAGFLHAWLASRGMPVAGPVPPFQPMETQPVETQP